MTLLYALIGLFFVWLCLVSVVAVLLSCVKRIERVLDK